MPDEHSERMDRFKWQLEHPEERLPSVCRTLGKLRMASSAGIVVSLVVGLVAAPLALILLPLFVYLRYHLPGCLRTLVSTINSLRTRDLPERLEAGKVISVFAYKHRDMPEAGNVLLGEVLGAGDAEMITDRLLDKMSATPVMAGKADKERGPTRSQTIGIVRVLSEPIWGTEQLVEGKVAQDDRGFFFVEDGRALLAGQAPTEE